MKKLILTLVAAALVGSFEARAQADISDMKAAVGIQRTAIESLNTITSIHGMLEIIQDGWLGFGFGFTHNFDTLLVGPDFRFNVVTFQGKHALFAEGQFGLVRTNSGTPAASAVGAAMGLLMGVDIQPVDQLHVSFAYGVQAKFGLNDTSVGITNNDFAGNFGIHWVF